MIDIPLIYIDMYIYIWNGIYKCPWFQSPPTRWNHHHLFSGDESPPTSPGPGHGWCEGGPWSIALSLPEKQKADVKTQKKVVKNGNMNEIEWDLMRDSWDIMIYNGHLHGYEKWTYSWEIVGFLHVLSQSMGTWGDLILHPPSFIPHFVRDFPATVLYPAW